MSIGTTYLQSVILRLETNKKLGTTTITRLDAAQLHWQPDGTSNSIAHIIKHLHGNMLSRWTDFLTTDGEKSGRHRDLEFENDQLTKEQLLELWETGWQCMLSAIGSLEEADLEKTVYVRSEAHSVIDAINRQLAHVPYHIGQIVYVGKMILQGNWESLSIPKGQSEAFNKAKTGR
ncbi:DUF1572 domain-containing protein [Chitinophaga nivalis]|uniref:DUF1572 domain-containing protein n=1 Tax=Chitinophaga nivalis TaxID=2991709 RepID=A0ABT3IQM6_9BACT|nr:DUF1572 domain-containing protein [Chitinophaga nivalis]MCW3464062.1 DUF1572 domain-containing protein [Chitinophaga nivalis]MCW3486248.1 DUF1572 domain-containing protein [Chitinophaga nivalis]